MMNEAAPAVPRKLRERVRSLGMAIGLSMIGFCPLPAGAQSMDYAALERLFREPVTTSATGSPQRASDVPANMEIISADDIRRSGADNIPDILQFVAGVDVRRYGVAQAEVAIRGYDQPGSPRLLVLIDQWPPGLSRRLWPHILAVASGPDR